MSDGGFQDALQPVTLYGIPNCDQVKKARGWLTEHGVEFTFHDFKKAGLSRTLIAHWLTTVDWTTLLNRKGTTWRGLPDERRAAVTDAEAATVLMLEAPSIVKRPVLQSGSRTLVGFDAAVYCTLFQTLFNSKTPDSGTRT